MVLGLLMAFSCANPIPPSGGPVDKAGPELLTENSTPNHQVNFEPSEIVFTFDEWIKLDNPNAQVLISPPLDKNPTFKLRGKEVRVILDPEEQLRENTTYTFEFGESIKDVNESNASEALKFVFSTGPVLDSLQLKGRILSIDRKTPVENVRVMLYDSIADSLPYLVRPSYTAKTDAQGRFTIQNLPQKSFKIFALADENKNYLFEPQSEALAFLDTIITISDSVPALEMVLFKEIPPFQMLKRELGFHKLVLEYNKIPDTLALDFPNTSFRLKEWGKDSAQLWLSKKQDSLTLFTLPTSLKRDTFLLKRKRKLKRDTQSVVLNKAAMKQPVLSAEDSLALFFSRPIIDVDFEKMTVRDTSNATLPIKFLQVAPRQINVFGKWPLGQELEITLLPEAVKSITNNNNRDTLSHQIFVPPSEKLGSIIMIISVKDPSIDRVIELTMGDNIVRTFVVKKGEMEKYITTKHLRPGDYTLLIIEDQNGDGEWTTGDYLKKRQPELKWKKELESLRENWDLQVELNL